MSHVYKIKAKERDSPSESILRVSPAGDDSFRGRQRVELLDGALVPHPELRARH